MTDALTIAQVHPNLPAEIEPAKVIPIDPASHFLPVPWEMLREAAAMIASAPGLAPQFKDTACCMFIAYQAARWGADPIAVASKTYFTGAGDKMRVGYEAQLVHALVEADPDLLEPLAFAYGYSDPARPMAPLRFVRVTGKLRAKAGNIVSRHVTTPTVAQIKIKNSPLWYSDPDQQLAYYGARLWARRYRPGRILGIYTGEEMASIANVEDVPARSLFEEDDAASFDTVAPTKEDEGAYARAEKKAAGVQDSRDPRDAEPNPEPPPAGTSEPDDIPRIRAWAEAERVRIIAMTDLDAIVAAGNALTSSKDWKRLLAYGQGEATRIRSSIVNRIEELRA